MFNTDLTIEEEVLLEQLLDGEKLNRAELLHRINSVASNTEIKSAKDIAKGLFEKVKKTSDYEFNEYRDILLQNVEHDG